MKIGVIGCGRWGSTHIKVLNLILKKDEIIASDPDEKKLDKIKSQVKNFYTDYKELIKKENPDGLIIAAPSILHYDIAKYSINNGINVLVEKPITTSVKQAEELINLATKKRVFLTPGHLFLYKKGFKEIYNNFDRNYKSTYIICKRINNGPEIWDEGVIYDLGIHDIYISLHLFNSKPKYVIASGQKIFDVIIEANIFLEFSSGIANILCSWKGLTSTREVHILNGSSEFLWNDTENELIIRKTTELKNIKVKNEKLSVYDKFNEQNKYNDLDDNALLEEDKSFIKTIEENKPPLVSAEEGLETIKIIEKIYKSIKKRKEIKL